MTTLAIAALGPDRPGIVAGLTAVLLQEHGNLEDSAMTILHGQFTMTMVVDTPVSAERVRADLAPVAERLGLVLSVREVEAERAETPATRHVVRVHGADRPGLLNRVAQLLADHGANVTDLATRLVGGAAPTYVMHIDCDLPLTVDAEVLRSALLILAIDLGVHATLQPADSDEL